MRNFTSVTFFPQNLLSHLTRRKLLGKPISSRILQDTSSTLLKIIEAKKKKKKGKESKFITDQTLGRHDDSTVWYLDWVQENKEGKRDGINK